MLFVGYDSTRENITGVADSLRHNLPRFYPSPLVDAMIVSEEPARDDIYAPYQELIIIGHSLGGLIVRRALADCAQLWLNEPKHAHSQRPSILDAKVRLFSPASAGFRAAGLLGTVKASGIWPALEMYLRRSSAFTDLQPGSSTLSDTRNRTQLLATQPGLEALRAELLWANPDDVVLPERYDTDAYWDSISGQTHRSVCKPNTNYPAPWLFARAGRYR